MDRPYFRLTLATGALDQLSLPNARRQFELISFTNLLITWTRESNGELRYMPGSIGKRYLELKQEVDQVILSGAGAPDWHRKLQAIHVSALRAINAGLLCDSELISLQIRISRTTKLFLEVSPI